jgi:hypothetical protein
LEAQSLLTWIDRLLADRRERVRQLRYLRQRLRQAFGYLDSLFDQPRRTDEGRVPAARNPVRASVMCPLCGKPYVRASGNSPTGIIYAHSDGRECRTDLAHGRSG